MNRFASLQVERYFPGFMKPVAPKQAQDQEQVWAPKNEMAFFTVVEKVDVGVFEDDLLGQAEVSVDEGLRQRGLVQANL